MIKFYIDHEDFVSGRINCNAGVAVLGASVVGGISKIWGASKAGDAQKEATDKAYWTNYKNQQNNAEMFAPYRDAGVRSLKELESRMPELTSDINLDDELAKNSTVKQAYDFTNKQGLKAVQNSAAKRGLGVSGAALKGATAFTTGLAKNTYLDLFNMENTNRKNAYDRLKGLVDTGTGAATNTANSNTAATKGMSDALIGQGNAEAAKYNAYGTALASIASDVGGWSYGQSRGMFDSNSTRPRTGGIYDMPVDDVYF